MLRRIQRSHATAIAYLALFLALGGTAYAINVTGADVQDESLTGRDIRDDSLHSSDIADGTVRSRDIDNNGIETQDMGPGANGADAYALIYFDGTINTSFRSKGIPQSSVSAATGNPGVICFDNLPFRPDSMMYAANGGYGIPSANRVGVSGGLQAIASGCPASPYGRAGYITGYDEADSVPAQSYRQVWVWFDY